MAALKLSPNKLNIATVKRDMNYFLKCIQNDVFDTNKARFAGIFLRYLFTNKTAAETHHICVDIEFAVHMSSLCMMAVIMAQQPVLGLGLSY